MKKKILITGIKGFIGKKLASELKKKFKIYGVSRKKYNNNPDYNIFFGDLSDKFFVNSINENFYAIINCAANTNHFEEYHRSYLDNCASLRNILLAKNIRFKKFIHISTEAVFLGAGKIDVNEFTDFPKVNLSTYYRTKKKAELILNKFSRNDCISIIIRTRLVWDSKESSVFHKIKSAIVKKDFAWVSNGDYYSVATHINNLILGIKCALKYGKNNYIYFITDRKKIKFKNLVENILGKKIYVPSIPRFFVYFLCLFNNILITLNFYKSKNINFSMSTYYLTLTDVTINDHFSSISLNYFPKNYYRKII
jgi:nucleoside-diphosphate-sugar epimerase